ncbi:NAD(P)-binding protein [Choiromyces venosus 120613-1]|uniref:NAD(P)-binding protein n=1 Tax=Choiromyces venosus 120613-1 TaxID=1336337 RepID=A0A3N4K642_9PEZI|nr:NAD(P)-binding protein [Choiromyces venosus 120613-1]
MAAPVPLILTHTTITALLTSLPAPAIHNIITSLTSSLHALTQPLSTSTCNRTLSSTPTLIQPPRQTLQNNASNYTTLIMPCSTPNLTCIKSVTLPTPPNPASPPNGVITLQDATGRLLALLNAEEVTAFRTACVSIALLLGRIRYGLAATKVVVFGAGKQAKWISRLLLKFIPALKHLVIIGREGSTRDKMETFVRKLRRAAEFKTEIYWRIYDGGEDSEVQADVGEADAIFCCTPSTVKLFPVEFLTDERKRYISLIGSYKPHMKEISPSYLRRDSVTVVVDSIETCLVEAGEVIQAGLKADDLLNIGSVISDFDNGLGEKYLGDMVFKCVGLAIMDLVVADEIVKLARLHMVGVEVPGFSS